MKFMLSVHKAGSSLRISGFLQSKILDIFTGFPFFFFFYYYYYYFFFFFFFFFLFSSKFVTIQTNTLILATIMP